MIDPNDEPRADRTRPVGKLSVRHGFRNAVLYLVVGYLCWCAFLWLFQDHIVFPKNAAPKPPDYAPYLNAVPLSRILDNGTAVHAWLIPANSASPQSPAPLLVYFHGNAEIADFQQKTVDLFRPLNINILIPEYRGYGKSGGSPSQDAIREDALHFINEVSRRPEVDASRIILHGRSLGGGVACDVAPHIKPAAIILESTFANAAQLAWGYGVPPLLVKNRFASDQSLAGYKGPLLIFHGTRDDILPVANGRALHALFPQSQYIEYDGTHNDFPGRDNEAAYQSAIYSFLVTRELATAPRPPTTQPAPPTPPRAEH